MIYLDNSATTKIDPEVFDAMVPWFKEEYGNPSSIYSLGRKARVAVEKARTEIAAALNAHPAELIFTSGGTESNNSILKSIVQESKLATNIVSSATEHHAILHPLTVLESTGTNVTLLPVDKEGMIVPSSLEAHNNPQTLVSVMHVNNEVGTIQPIQTLRSTVPNALFHTDAVQSFGKIPVNVQELGVDFLSISAHKIHGPKGIGAMFIRKGIDFKAHQQGGAQERNRRAGTEAVALIVGFQVAVRKAIEEQSQRFEHFKMLQTTMTSLLQEKIPNIRLNTPERNSIPTIVNISFKDTEIINGESLLQQLDIHGIACSNGSACVSGSLQPSHVLVAMGLPTDEAKVAVRYSFSKDTTIDEVTQAASTLAEIVENMRDVS
jgi:cysteine desulfurase